MHRALGNVVGGIDSVQGPNSVPFNNAAFFQDISHEAPLGEGLSVIKQRNLMLTLFRFHLIAGQEGQAEQAYPGRPFLSFQVFVSSFSNHRPFSPPAYSLQCSTGSASSEFIFPYACTLHIYCSLLRDLPSALSQD